MVQSIYMHRNLFVIMILLSAGPWCRGEEKISTSCRPDSDTDSASMSKQLLRIEQALLDALAPGDTSLWNKYLDPDCYTITEDGTGYFKKEFLATFSPLPKGFLGHIDLIKPVFTFSGNAAVLHYVADEYESVYGQNLHTTYGMVDTWYRTDTSWKMIGSQVFEIPQLPPSIKVAAKTLREYTGRYEISATDTCSISVKNDTLFIQKKKGGPVALFAETETIFFRTADTRGRKIFVRDETGGMLMLERRNGNDLVWKKIKTPQ
jgi:hypothetical protein